MYFYKFLNAFAPNPSDAAEVLSSETKFLRRNFPNLWLIKLIHYLNICPIVYCWSLRVHQSKVAEVLLNISSTNTHADFLVRFFPVESGKQTRRFRKIQNGHFYSHAGMFFWAWRKSMFADNVWNSWKSGICDEKREKAYNAPCLFYQSNLARILTVDRISILVIIIKQK